MKTCSKCKEIKEFSEFSKDNRNKKDGYVSYCKECRKKRYIELKTNSILQLEKEIKSSIILENKLLKEENKKICCTCKNTFNVEHLANGGMCKSCIKEYRVKKDLNSYAREYRKTNKDTFKNKDKERRNTEEYKKYQKEWYLKKKLEKLQLN